MIQPDPTLRRYISKARIQINRKVWATDVVTGYGKRWYHQLEVEAYYRPDFQDQWQHFWFVHEGRLYLIKKEKATVLEYRGRIVKNATWMKEVKDQLHRERKESWLEKLASNVHLKKKVSRLLNEEKLRRITQTSLLRRKARAEAQRLADERRLASSAASDSEAKLADPPARQDPDQAETDSADPEEESAEQESQPEREQE